MKRFSVTTAALLLFAVVLAVSGHPALGSPLRRKHRGPVTPAPGGPILASPRPLPYRPHGPFPVARPAPTGCPNGQCANVRVR